MLALRPCNLAPSSDLALDAWRKWYAGAASEGASGPAQPGRAGAAPSSLPSPPSSPPAASDSPPAFRTRFESDTAPGFEERHLLQAHLELQPTGLRVMLEQTSGEACAEENMQSSVWVAGVVLAKAMQRSSDVFPRGAGHWRGKRVLELGAGCGACGIQAQSGGTAAQNIFSRSSLHAPPVAALAPQRCHTLGRAQCAEREDCAVRGSLRGRARFGGGGKGGGKGGEEGPWECRRHI